MPTTTRILFGVTTALAFALVACGGERKEPPPDPAPVAAGEPARSAGSGGARTLPIPGRAIDPPPAGAGEGSRALVWKVPSAWIEEAPKSSMRRAQYRVPGAAGDGECIVHYFGPNQGGDAASNAARWAGQFTQPDGRASEQVMKTSKLEGAGIEVMVVEVTGTYSGGMTMATAPTEEQRGAMLLGAIAAGPDANWFFKLTGPEPTIRAQRAAFEEMLRSLKVGG